MFQTNSSLLSVIHPLRFSTASEQLKQAEAFIRSNTDSKVCVYIIVKNYFLKQKALITKKIKELINVLTGPMRDDPYIYSLSEQIDKQSQLAVGNVAPFTSSLPDVNGKKSSEIGHQGQVHSAQLRASECSQP